jgi:hypothetical protein
VSLRGREFETHAPWGYEDAARRACAFLGLDADEWMSHVNDGEPLWYQVGRDMRYAAALRKAAKLENIR